MIVRCECGFEGAPQRALPSHPSKKRTRRMFMCPACFIQVVPVVEAEVSEYEGAVDA